MISSTSSPHVLLGAEELATVADDRLGRPLLLIDLAVPRDIDPACDELAGVTLLDIDGLQAQVARHISVRKVEARRAEGIVEEEIQAFAGLARLARGDADRDARCARAATTWSRRCWPRTRAAGRR